MVAVRCGAFLVTTAEIWAFRLFGTLLVLGFANWIFQEVLQ